MTDNAATDKDAEVRREQAKAEPSEVWTVLRAAFEVLWLPIALFMSGFFVFYLLMWLWLRVF